jgi:hypothetical protein
MKTNLISNKSAISTAVIAIVAIIVVAAVAGGIYFATTQKPSSPSASESPTPSATVSQSPSQSPTPEPTASIAPTQTTNPSTSANTNVSDASSLQYSVSLSADTPSALRGNYTYYAKNIGSSSFMMRIDSQVYSTPEITILNGEQQKAWEYSNGKWTEIPAYGTYFSVWQGYVDVLSSRSGTGDFSYSLSGATVRIYDVSVNPVLPDSLFQHS